MNRTCKYCGKEKSLEEFFKDKGFYSYECKECHKEKRRAYYAKNREHIQQKRKEWVEANPEKVKAAQKKANEKRKIQQSAYKKEYELIHQDDIRAQRKLYYQANKEQIKQKRRKYYQDNKEEIAKNRKLHRQTDEYKAYMKSYKERNREKVLAQKRASNHRNSDTYKEWIKANEKGLSDKRKVYYEKNKAKIFEYIYERKSKDPLYKLKFTLRSRIYTALKRKSWKKGGTTEKLVGADINTVKRHIEMLFKDGMAWENHGEWHIDHIKPLASAETEEEIMKLFHYTNLQPLWAKENLKKSNKQVERVE